MPFPWVELLTSGGAGAALMKGVDVLMGRKGREVRALGQAIDTLSGQLKTADARMDEFGQRLDECRRQHEECEKGRRQDRAHHQRELADLRGQIESMMQGEVATYSAIRRPATGRRGGGR